MTPTKETQTNLEETHERNKRIAHKQKQINGILQKSLEEKKERTVTSLSKISLSIDKNAPKTKKLINKLTKKYKPLEEKICKMPKTHAHIMTKHESTHKYEHTNTNTNTVTSDSGTLSCPSTSWGSPRDTSGYNQLQMDTHLKSEETAKWTSQAEDMIVDLTTDIPLLHMPDFDPAPTQARPDDFEAPMTDAPTTACNTQDSQKDNWEQLLWDCYSPSHPALSVVSSGDEAEAEGIDPEFAAKLDELFGPLSP